MAMTRRGFGRLGAMTALAGLVPAGASSAQADEPLKVLAKRRGLTFGAMIGVRQLAQPDLRALLVREAAMTVPENDMKWGVTQPTPGPPNYAGADAVADFAAENGLALRGHTAIWYRNLPKWAASAIGGSSGREVFETRIRGLLGHYRDRVAEWDVVNEEIEPKDGRADFRRNSPFLAAFGPDYVADAFRIAHEADPHALLFYNDYGIEYRHRGMQERRDGVLRLLTGLKTAGAPIHGFGIQSHLIPVLDFQPKLFRDFLAEVADLGLRISITELDVNDSQVDGPPEQRDRVLADHARRYLDVALDEKAVGTVVTWGLTDRDTWLNAFMRRADGASQRPLPFDSDLRPKPLRDAIAAAFAHAPDRR